MAGQPRLFERTVLPHLDAAYNLARWLLHNEHETRDVVQEATMRTLKYFDILHGEDAHSSGKPHYEEIPEMLEHGGGFYPCILAARIYQMG